MPKTGVKSHSMTKKDTTILLWVAMTMPMCFFFFCTLRLIWNYSCDVVLLCRMAPTVCLSRNNGSSLFASMMPGTKATVFVNKPFVDVLSVCAAFCPYFFFLRKINTKHIRNFKAMHTLRENGETEHSTWLCLYHGLVIKAIFRKNERKCQMKPLAVIRKYALIFHVVEIHLFRYWRWRKVRAPWNAIYHVGAWTDTELVTTKEPN